MPARDASAPSAVEVCGSGARERTAGPVRRSSVVRDLDPPEGSIPMTTTPPAARSARRSPSLAALAVLLAAAAPVPRPPSPAPTATPAVAPPTGSPPSSRPRTACSPSASAVPTSSPTRASPSTRSSPCSPAGRRRRPRRRPRARRARRGQPHRLRHRASRRPTDRAANAVAKTLLARGDLRRRRRAPALDLEADLRGLMETDGDDPGRFTDTDSLGFGNFANGIGQALAILALDRTAGGVAGRRRRLPARPAVLRRQLPALPVRLRAVVRPASVTVDDPHVRRPGRGRRRRDGVRAHGAPRGAVVHRGAPTPIDGAVDLPARPAAGLRRLLRHRRGEQQHHRPGRRRPARGRRGRGGRRGRRVPRRPAERRLRRARRASPTTRRAFDAGIDGRPRPVDPRPPRQGALGLGLPAYGGIGTVAPVTAGLDDVGVPGRRRSSRGHGLGGVGDRRRVGHAHRGGLRAR